MFTIPCRDENWEWTFRIWARIFSTFEGVSLAITSGTRGRLDGCREILKGSCKPQELQSSNRNPTAANRCSRKKVGRGLERISPERQWPLKLCRVPCWSEACSREAEQTSTAKIRANRGKSLCYEDKYTNLNNVFPFNLVSIRITHRKRLFIAFWEYHYVLEYSRSEHTRHNHDQHQKWSQQHHPTDSVVCKNNVSR